LSIPEPAPDSFAEAEDGLPRRIIVAQDPGLRLRLDEIGHRKFCDAAAGVAVGMRTADGPRATATLRLDHGIALAEGLVGGLTGRRRGRVWTCPHTLSLWSVLLAVAGGEELLRI